MRKQSYTNKAPVFAQQLRSHPLQNGMVSLSVNNIADAAKGNT